MNMGMKRKVDQEKERDRAKENRRKKKKETEDLEGEIEKMERELKDEKERNKWMESELKEEKQRNQELLFTVASLEKSLANVRAQLENEAKESSLKETIGEELKKEKKMAEKLHADLVRLLGIYDELEERFRSMQESFQRAVSHSLA